MNKYKESFNNIKMAMEDGCYDSVFHKDDIDMPGADAAFNPDRRVLLDRRAVNNERRGDHDSDYRGPALRNTIDRRMNSKDRRK